MNSSTDHPPNGSTNGQRFAAAETGTRGVRRRLGPRLAGLVFGALLGLLLPVLFILYYRSGSQLPALTRQRLDAAENLWQTHGSASYAMNIRIEGRQPGVVQIEVRDGRTTAMTRDGVTPKRRAAWDAWSVPSMFDMLETELAGAGDPAKAFGAPSDARVIERAEFDPNTGYPRIYQRFVLGTALDMSWQVEQFRPLDHSPSSPPPTSADQQP